MKCWKCGAELMAGVQFCRECGAKFETQKRFCRECGSELNADVNFCRQCGAKVQNKDNAKIKDKAINTEIRKNQSKSICVDHAKLTADEIPTSPVVSDEKTNPFGTGIKEIFFVKWNKLDLFCKAITISSVIVFILTAVAICTKETLPTVISIFQIATIAVTVLMHKGIIKVTQKWPQYLALCAAFLLSIGNIAAYSIGNSSIQQVNPNKADIYSDTIELFSPCSNEDCLGKNKADIISVFSEAGFFNITEQELADLEPTALEKEGTVEGIMIDGIKIFSAGQKFSDNSNIIIAYHSVKRAKLPVTSSDAKSIQPEALIQEFRDAGFVNIQTEEVTDLDPDIGGPNYQNEILIDENSTFDTNTDFPLTAAIKIITHRTYEKYMLKVVIDFVENLIFSTYDVNMEIDGEVTTLAHGQNGTFEYHLKSGKYTVFFTSVESPSQNGKAEIEVIGNTETSIKIACHSDRITTEILYVENNDAVGEDEAMVPYSASNCKYKNYDEVSTWFRDAGFTNISTEILYDIYWGWTKEGEVESVSIDGNTAFVRGAIFKKNVPVIITYHMSESDDPTKIAVEKASEMYIGKNYLEVEQTFKNMGFTNIVLSSVSTTSSNYSDGEVSSVEIGGSFFGAGDKFKPSEEITIKYYCLDVPQSKTYSIDKDLVVIQCERDTKYSTMYHIAFAEIDSDGNQIREYKFGHCVNPRAMGKNFHVIGDFPSWFYVGATVHVKANWGYDGLSETDTFVSEVSGAGISDIISSTAVILPEPSSKLGKDYNFNSSATVSYINVDGVKNTPTICTWNGATVTDGVAEYLDKLISEGFNVQITSYNNKSPYDGFTYYETYFKVSNSELSWTMYLNVQSEKYIEYELDININ